MQQNGRALRLGSCTVRLTGEGHGVVEELEGDENVLYLLMVVVLALGVQAAHDEQRPRGLARGDATLPDDARPRPRAPRRAMRRRACTYRGFKRGPFAKMLRELYPGIDPGVGGRNGLYLLHATPLFVDFPE